MSFLLDTNVVSEWTKTRPNAGVDEQLRNDLTLRFERRIIGVDGAIADEWGRMIARREAARSPHLAPWMHSLRQRHRSMPSPL